MDILFVPVALDGLALLGVERVPIGPYEQAEGAIDEHSEARHLRHDDDRGRAGAPA